MEMFWEFYTHHSLLITIVTSVIIAFVFFLYQVKYFRATARNRVLFNDFFDKNANYNTSLLELEKDILIQISLENIKGRDLVELIKEINKYVQKTKGTTDFAVIQNKVERKLNMRHDQFASTLAFPTYIGLMGTFSGVFIGVLSFILGFNGDGINDESIQNLLIGVLVSMSTSFIGLLLTTINNDEARKAKKKIEEDKNDFYDFIQTELMPNLDVSLVSALSKLHETVANFEPAFSKVISGFQATFESCTNAFGKDFAEQVHAVSIAVEVMGKNMDKINQNVEQHKILIDTIKSNEIVNGLDKYIEAANHFVGITKSLDKFEEARRMMLAAAQEAIAIQNQYLDSLRIPQEIAIRINQILDRIKDFEDNINGLGTELSKREILGNDVVNAIRDQVNSIASKSKLADRYTETADEKLEILYREQIAIISQLTVAYKNAIESHIEGFENMLSKQTQELEKRHEEFLKAVEERFTVEDVKKEFTNLRRLETIESALTAFSRSSVKDDSIKEEFKKVLADIAKLREELNASLDKAAKSEDVNNISKDLTTVKTELSEINKNTKEKSRGGWFGRS